MKIQILKEILELAKWAPSGDNSQPWKFQWIENELRIWNLYELGKHAYNQGGTATLIALGGLLEYVRLAAQERGFSLKIQLMPSNFYLKNDAVLAIIKFISSEPKHDPLSDWLQKRCTDRRLFKKGELSDSLKREIQDDSDSFSSANAHIISAHSVNLIEAMADSEKILWTWNQAHRDLLKWIRFSEKEARETKNGLPWRNLGVNLNDMLMLKLIRKYPNLVKTLKPILNRVATKTAKKQIQSSAVLIFFTLQNNEKESLIQLGQLAIRTWLRLNAFQFGVQPMSSGVLFPYYRREFGLDSEIESEMGSHFDMVKNLLADALKLQDNELAVWCFRAGKSTELPSKMRTFRRSPDIILSY